MIRVFATREGLEGQRTSSGYLIDTIVNFVALPHVKALGRHVRIYPDGYKQYGDFHGVLAQVLDVGPHSDADPYVFQNATEPEFKNWDLKQLQPNVAPLRPLAESGISKSTQTNTQGNTSIVTYQAKNKAGIDLGAAVWKSLGMTDNAYVWWEFID